METVHATWCFSNCVTSYIVEEVARGEMCGGEGWVDVMDRGCGCIMTRMLAQLGKIGILQLYAGIVRIHESWRFVC